MAMQLSTLGQPRVFSPLSSVLSLVCCLCEWESHHLAITRNVISPALPRSSSVSVSMNKTIQGSVWPSGRLHSDYMAEVSKTAALDPVHNVMLDVELIFDVCISNVRDSWHTRIFRRQPISNACRLKAAYYNYTRNLGQSPTWVRPAP